MLVDYAKRFGFYSIPPLETPTNERAPSGLYKGTKLFDPKEDTDVDPGRFAFGQERLLVTPLQMAMVAATIANNGVVMKPYVVERIVAPDGSIVVRTKQQDLGRAVKPETAQAVGAMMKAAVEGGTGTAAQHPGRHGRRKDRHRGNRHRGPEHDLVHQLSRAATGRRSQSRSSSRSRTRRAAKRPHRSPATSCRRFWGRARTPNLNRLMAAGDPLIDTLFDGRYLIIRKLGSGGMANVYLAADQELGRRVAIKILDDRHARDEQFVERFRREAQNAAGLSHPSIVSIYDRGDSEGTYYIAMEYVEGRTLKELLVARGPSPLGIAIDYTRQILSASASRTATGSCTATSSRTT